IRERERPLGDLVDVLVSLLLDEPGNPEIERRDRHACERYADDDRKQLFAFQKGKHRALVQWKGTLAHRRKGKLKHGASRSRRGAPAGHRRRSWLRKPESADPDPCPIVEWPPIRGGRARAGPVRRRDNSPASHQCWRFNAASPLPPSRQ